MSESNITQGIIWQGTPAKRERKQEKINRQADRFDVFSGTQKITKKRILAPAKSVDRFAKKIDRSADRQIENLIFWDTLLGWPNYGVDGRLNEDCMHCTTMQTQCYLESHKTMRRVIHTMIDVGTREPEKIKKCYVRR
jgi:hypothetical protein